MRRENHRIGLSYGTRYGRAEVRYWNSARLLPADWRTRWRSDRLGSGLAFTVVASVAIALSVPFAMWRLPLALLSVVACVAALVELARSMRVRWDFYHGGVLFVIYADMMILTLALVLLWWPYPPA